MSEARPSDYINAVQSGLVIFDGATGTNLQLVGLTADDFGGRRWRDVTSC